MKLKFVGAAGGIVTGSSFLVDEKLLVDLGMYQGTKEVSALNWEPLGFDAKKLEVVVVTHAHLDHCGRLPLLIKEGFGGKVYMTEATRDLVEIVLLDAVKVANEDEGRVPLYDEEEVENLLRMVEVVEYREKKDWGGGLGFRLLDAGHILGSASVEVFNGTEIKLVLSGDLGNSPQDLIRPTEYVRQAEVVVMESTYGERFHGDEDIEEVLIGEIKQIERSGGVLMIPAFSLERTQELLHCFDHMKKMGSVSDKVRVFLDSPMAIKATEVFRKHDDLYNNELKKHAKVDDPFDFPGLAVVLEASESRKIKEIGGAKVIIAGSGMMAGGRIVNHALEYLGNEKTRLLFVGYQAPGTLGRMILDGKKSVSIYGKVVDVRASIGEITSMSAHADKGQLLTWLGEIDGVKRVFLVHGEELARRKLKMEIEKKWGYKVELPLAEEEFEI